MNQSIMENFDSFYGFVFYKNEKHMFNFHDFKLMLEIDRSDRKRFLDKTAQLGTNVLYGKIGNAPETVLFFFDDIIVSSNFSSLFFSSFNVTVVVKYYFILNKNLPQRDLFVDFRNNAFQKWLDVYPVYFSDKPFTLVDKLSINKKSIEMKGLFSINKKRIMVNPSYYVNFSETHFNFYSDLRVSCLDEMSHADIFELCMRLLHFIQFVFYRFYVDLGDIYIGHKLGEKDGKNITENIGRLFINYSKKEFEPISLQKYFDYGFIRWEDIFSHISKLMLLIEQKDLYLSHLPEKRIDRFKTDYPDISLLSAAFESEFSRCFPNFITEKKEDNDYIDLIDKINKMEANKRQREILKNKVLNNFQKPSFAEKAKYAFYNFKDILKEFWLDNEKSIDDAIKIFRDARNKIDHGDLDFAITNEIANVFYYLRIVILCMQLTRIGVEKTNFLSVIRPVLGLGYNR